MQVKVTNGGTGNPGPMTQFPGAYSDSDEYANFSIYNGFKDFPMPGPEVWSGGGGGDNGGNSAPPAEFNQEIPQPSRSDESSEFDDAPEFGDAPAEEAPEFDAPEPETPSAPVDSPPTDDAPEPCTRNQRRSRRSRRSRRAVHAH